MSLAIKEAQFQGLDGASISADELSGLMEDVGDLRDSSKDKEDTDGEFSGKGEISVEVDGDELVSKEFDFVVPLYPGADDDSDIEEDIVVEDDEDVEVERDPWSCDTHELVPWGYNMLQACPRHSGKDTAGLERALAFVNAIGKKVSRDVQGDINGVLDIGQVEKLRDDLYNASDRLTERLERVKKSKRRKSAEENHSLVKEGQKSAHVGGVSITVPLFIAALAKTCINGMVSAGHDIEVTYSKLATKYDLGKREELELRQLLNDMGYAMRMDRMYSLDEDFDPRSSDNGDWAANYHS